MIPDFIKERLQKPWLLFLIAFAIGLFFFFPLHRVQGLLLETIRRSSGIRVTVGPLGMSRGIFPEGGLVGLSAEGFQATVAPGQVLECDRVKISPQLWRMLTLRWRVAVECTRNDAGSLLLTLTSGTLFKSQEMDIGAYLNKADLSVFLSGIGVQGITGIAYGSIEAQALNPMTGVASETKIDLNLIELKTPSVFEPTFNLRLPALPLDRAELRVEIMGSNKFKIERLLIGKAEGTPIHADFRGNLTMNPGMMFPQGTLAGKIKVDQAMEEGELRDLKLDLYFGPKKENGYREFKRKELNGSPISLLNPPIE